MQISDKNISLDSENCLLKIDDQTIELEMRPPCFFVADDSGTEAGVKYYEDINSHILLIVGSPAPKDGEYPLTLQRNDCGEELQALILEQDQPTLSKIYSNTLICAGVGADEKMYYFLSHQ